NLAVYEQVHLFYLAEMKEPLFAAGEESREVKLFTEAEIPWNRLAFSTITHALRFFFNDQKQGILENGRYSVHTIDLSR
ncbi:MAG: NUDIX hydrolase, partial [Oxalobacter sp.]|nr:NUDIX hydrolase [Oxalobacter sp.]